MEELAWIRLSLVRGLSFEAMVRLLTEFVLPETVFEMPRHAVAKVVGEELAEELMSPENEERAREVREWLGACPDRSILTIADADYPQGLKRSGAPVPVLYLRGNRELLDREMIALAGSDRADALGIADARDFAGALARRGLAPVLSLANALSCEAARAVASLGLADGGAIAVSAAGVDRAHPAASREAFVETAAQGLVVSVLPPGESWSRQSEEARRAVLVGMSSKLLVVQAEPGAETLAYARLAADLGRDVHAIPGSIHSALYKGCHRLIRDGATLTESVRDLVS